MDIINFEVVNRISLKTNKPYTAIELTFANGYKELLFPNSDRIRLLMDLPNP